MKIVIGMSGGVDSSAAAGLLQREGHDLIGVFMKNWDDKDDDICTQAADFEDAKAVCLKLGIPFYGVNFTKEYEERVFSYFLKEYGEGRTPNPDVFCNKEIKFKAFVDYARKTFQADAIATGHYARTLCDEKTGEVCLLKGIDRKKDQSYFLSFLNPEQLKDAIFPLGELKKDHVRQIAAQMGLRTAAKRDSTGICFIGERDFRTFLSRYFPVEKGPILDAVSGRLLGEHDGLMYYTIGQRRHIGLGNLGDGKRWYVEGKNLQTNTLFVACGDDNPILFRKGFTAAEYNFITRPPGDSFETGIKYRYQQNTVPATVFMEDKTLKIIFREPQMGIAPGQIGVMYDDDRCLGGAVIKDSIRL